MRWRTCTLVLVASWVVSVGAHAAPRAVIELFTSQGCSSCPPADKLFATLAHDPALIVLSLPVDYWDRLGWKDTLAKHAFTERQTSYSTVRGDGQIYTPQAVINGTVHANGADRFAIDAAVSETVGSLRVPLSARRAGDGLIISVGAAPSGARQGTVVLLPFLASRDVAIGRGENARNKVTYTNVVRDIVPVAEWSGSAIERSIPLERNKDYDGVVVLLQAGSPQSPGAILGAVSVPLDHSAAGLPRTLY